jgi:hypothetical protein
MAFFSGSVYRRLVSLVFLESLNKHYLPGTFSDSNHASLYFSGANLFSSFFLTVLSSSFLLCRLHLKTPFQVVPFVYAAGK